eukprot:TRINITY_DN7667_c0_g1_i5.p1 TRINITY_DN7667_c0_g1~~TRINITY_DN7667_c0_g1_i5.p1  ORF type:complete len:176 (-),score=34.61 TRINITY_DN7667_c0_g1_i5:364-891(-)
MADQTQLASEIEPEEEFDIKWINSAFLQFNNPLTEMNVMDLFVTSPFFNRDCINSVLARLRLSKPNPEERREEEENLLKTFRGRDYNLLDRWCPIHPEHPEEILLPPRLFNIIRQYRHGSSDVQQNPPVTTTGLYFVVDGVVYQAPTLLDVLRTSLVSSFSGLWWLWHKRKAGGV